MGEWKRKNRKEVYRAHRVRVYEDEMVRPDGETVFYDYVENQNGAGILLVDQEGRFILVRQYRNVMDSLSLEIPAGSLEEDGHREKEAFQACALREAEEETGFVPGKVHFIQNILASTGLFREETALYIGWDLKQGSIHRDPDEFMEVVRLTEEEALELIRTGEIRDAKTIIAILSYVHLKAKKIFF